MTIRYLIDTDWVIDHLNAIERVVTRLKALRPHGLALSTARRKRVSKFRQAYGQSTDDGTSHRDTILDT
jgi:hypothetical protein